MCLEVVKKVSWGCPEGVLKVFWGGFNHPPPPTEIFFIKNLLLRSKWNLILGTRVWPCSVLLVYKLYGRNCLSLNLLQYFDVLKLPHNAHVWLLTVLIQLGKINQECLDIKIWNCTWWKGPLRFTLDCGENVSYTAGPDRVKCVIRGLCSLMFLF